MPDFTGDGHNSLGENILRNINYTAMKSIKYLLLFTAAIWLNAELAAQNDKQERKIKSIVVYQEKHDMIVAKRYKDSEQYFDANGNLLEDIVYKQGKITKHFKYQYDSENNKIREEKYDPAGRLLEYSEYKYENGLRTLKTVYDANKKLKSKKIYVYSVY